MSGSDVDHKDLVPGPEEIDAKLLQLPVQPTAVNDSGHGRHVYLYLKEPIDAEDAEQVANARELQKQLSACLSAERLAGANYAPNLFAKEREAKASKISKNALTDAMNRLFEVKRIRVDQAGKGGQSHCRSHPTGIEIYTIKGCTRVRPGNVMGAW